MKLWRISLFCWIVAQTFYFGNYGPDLLFFKQLRPDRLFFIALLVFFIRAGFRKETVSRRLESADLLVLLLCMAMGLSFLGSGALYDDSEGKNKWLNALFNITIYPYTAFFCVRSFAYDKQFAVSLLKLICALGIYLAFTGVFEHYAISSLVWPSYIMDPSLGTHFERSRGPFMESVAMGRVLTIAFAAWVVFRLEATGFMRRISWPSMVAALASIYFTATRGPWLGLALVMLAFVVYRTPARRTIIQLSLCIIVAAGLGVSNKFSLLGKNLFTQRQSTVTDRVVTWLVSIEMVKVHPVAGIGFGRFNAEWENYYSGFKGLDFDSFDGSHNTFLTMAAEGGLVTLALYIALGVSMCRRCIRVYRTIGPEHVFERSFAVMSLGILWMYLFTGWFSDLRWNTVQNTLVFVILGVVAAMEKDFRRREVDGIVG